ncbi:unnamed protein product [Cyclocybe aegerita]|uniref:DDE Tnp4 domain-containing protein n=1 Tax=Cyclocybe aegerita TaxID=1973307 RepID=A0A8S0WZ26_CYCAE|nr:unnamed protein product [Cyclocybe aegerita]
MPSDKDRKTLQQRVLTATAYFLHIIGAAAMLYQQANYWKQPYHTSALTGQAWVDELINGHPDRIFNKLGMRLHILPESSQCSVIWPFYDLYVKLPDLLTPIPDYILTNSKFFPYFRSALGALDGTHINAFTSAADRHASHDCKGGITQNCLAACSFDFRFLYIITGFEGSAANATMENTTLRMQGLQFVIRYWFPIVEFATILLNGAEQEPANKEELYNLRHAQARNVVEHIFGVLKKCWDILNRPPQYDLSIQAKIPAGLGSVHNFIMDHDETDLEHYLDQEPTPENNTSTGALGDGSISCVERARATALRDEIATQMWNDYQQFLCEHPEVLEENFVPENE